MGRILLYHFSFHDKHDTRFLLSLCEDKVNNQKIISTLHFTIK